MDSLQTRLPDFILLDLGLPKMDGFEILETGAKGLAFIRGVSLVILTGCMDFDYLPKIYDLPIYGYINKPMRVEHMQAISARIVGLNRPR